MNVTKSTKEIEFELNGKFYKYQYERTQAHGYSYIYSGTTEIYGPFKSTPEGLEVHTKMMEYLSKDESSK